MMLAYQTNQTVYLQWIITLSAWPLYSQVWDSVSLIININIGLQLDSLNSADGLCSMSWEGRCSWWKKSQSSGGKDWAVEPCPSPGMLSGALWNIHSGRLFSGSYEKQSHALYKLFIVGLQALMRAIDAKQAAGVDTVMESSSPAQKHCGTQFGTTTREYKSLSDYSDID